MGVDTSYHPKITELDKETIERADLSEYYKDQKNKENDLDRFNFKDKLDFDNDVSQSIINQIFRNRGVIANEQWVDVITIPSKVISIDEHQISCECSIDIDNDKFETRSFPKELFSNIPNLDINSPIFIKINYKPGSSRIDVLDGKGIVDMNIFELNSGWDKLKGSGLDQPFEL